MSAWILGNRLDLLAALLAKVLEEEKSDPFTPPIILIPNEQMKSWLWTKLVHFSSKKALAGLKIFAWQEGVRYLLNEPGKEPSYVELYLAIYKELEMSPDEALQKYLKEASLVDLAEELADLFILYGYYGRNFLQTGSEDWQRAIYKKLFVEGPWKASWELLETKTFSLLNDVYCFGCNHLPRSVWNALLRLKNFSIFHFSPCMMYWEDLRNSRERKALLQLGKKRKASQSQIDEMQRYLLEDVHPLLANWGKIGRDTAFFLNEYNLETEEIYEEKKESKTALHKLQQEFLFHKFESLAEPDESIKLHKVGSSRLREIQVLFDEMLRAHEKGISFSDMLVLAPDLNDYAPFIELIFQNPSCSILYQMFGVERAFLEQNSWQGFKRLLDLSQSRFEADDVLFLLKQSAFRAKRGWGIERIDQIRRWIQEARIRWGFDAKYKKQKLSEWLQQDLAFLSAQGSWKQGRDRLIASLVYLVDDESLEPPTICPVEGVNLGDADALEEFLEFLDGLEKDLRPLADGSKKNLQEWADFIKNLYESYFYLSEEKETFEKILYGLRRVFENLRKQEFCFSALLPLFEKKQGQTIGSNLLHAARFSSFQEGAILPCKALFLIGLDEESFPRKSRPCSLNHSKSLEDFPPLGSEIDRYLFLQAISSAQSQIFISYRHISEEDGKKINPSLLVQEWLDFRKIFSVEHPSFPWHKRCFEDVACSLMSFQNYEAARLFYTKKKQIRFFPSFQSCSPRQIALSGTIQLRDLKAFFSHPWKYYVQKTLLSRFEEEEKEDWSEFSVDRFEKFSLLKKGLQKPLDELILLAEKKGKFPVGLFHKIAKLELAETTLEWKAHLEAWNILPEEIGSFSLKESSFHQSPWEYPPLKISSETKIAGNISWSCLKGPLHFGEDSFSSMLRSWPEHLAILCSLNSQNIFCVRSGKMKTVSSPKEALIKCLELYALGAEILMPFVSQWAEALIRRQDAKELKKALEPNLAGWDDFVYDWVMARIEPFDVEELIDLWSPYFREKLQALLDLYPLKGSLS